MKIVLPTLHVRRSPQAVPLAAASLAATLANRPEHSTLLLDFYPDQAVEQLAAEILATAPDLVAFPFYSWNRTTLLAVGQTLKARRPELLLVAGGPDATADPHGLLADGTFMAVIRGEGELTFTELIDLLGNGNELRPLAGLSLRTAEEIVDGPERPPAAPEDLPSPWLTGILDPVDGVLWEVARGCPFDCSYCFDSLGSRQVRKFPLERLAAELDLFAGANIAQAWAIDSSFNVPAARGRELLALIAERAPALHVHLEARIETIDDATIRLLANISCSLQIGLQSIQPQVLRAIRRPVNLSLYQKVLPALNSAGVSFGLDLIYGLPCDSLAGFRASLGVALDFVPNHVDLFPLAVLPGTRLFDEIDTYGLVAESSPPYTLQSSQDWSAADLARAAEIAAATDLFYNQGRAVGLFATLLQVTDLEAVPFLEGFADWLLLEQGVFRTVLLAVDLWRPEEILPMQEGYIQWLLQQRERNDLLQPALDLLRYHFHYAETLLGPETPPAEEAPPEEAWTQPWCLAPHAQLVPFAYEVINLLEMGEFDLEEFAELFRPVGSVALFLRRGEEVICESLEEDALNLLRHSDGHRTPEAIFAGSVPREAGEEILYFAIAEGLLLPAMGWGETT
jgi:radical SAM superfamily enzyme YgiQ (UPF0313 family)